MADIIFPENVDFDALTQELAEVLVDLAKKEDLKKSEALTKAVPEETPGESHPPEESSSPAPEMSGSSAPEGSPEMSGGSPAPEGEGAPMGPEGGQDAPPTVEEIEGLYSQLPPDQLQLHFQALQMAAQKMGVPLDASAPPEAPPEAAGAPPPAGPPSPSPSAPPPPADQMAMKMESKIVELEQELAKSRENNEKIVEILEKVVGQPMAKSINGINYTKYVPAEPVKPLKKSFEELTKSEINERLKVAVTNPQLSRVTRDAVNAWAEGRANAADSDVVRKLVEAV